MGIRNYTIKETFPDIMYLIQVGSNNDHYLQYLFLNDIITLFPRAKVVY